MRQLPKILFFLSLCMLAYAYGFGSARYQVFPYQVIMDAKTAITAWKEVVVAPENPLFMFADDEGRVRPEIRQLVPQDDKDLLLITGGPSVLLDECPTFGCMAWIINRDGEVLHTWEVDFGALWADTPDHVGLKEHQRFSPIGLHLFDNGELLVSFQNESLFPYGVGLAKFSRDGQVLWKKANFVHHWFSVAPDGKIYAPFIHATPSSPIRLGETRRHLYCDSGTIVADGIVVLGPDGGELNRVSMIDLLVDNEFTGMLGATSDRCDPVHLNFVEYVTEEMAAASGLDSGDLIVSARHVNLVAAIDAKLSEVKWASVGRVFHQHAPRVLADGGIAVFDNWGGAERDGGSRIVRMHYGTDSLETVFPRVASATDADFWTLHQGHIDPHDDGKRILVSLSNEGRILEIDLERHRVLWEMINSHDLGPTEDNVIARMTVSSAYYVGMPAFLASE